MLSLSGLAATALLAVGAVCLSGCANLGYYWQSTRGHLAMMNAARPVQDVLGDPTTPEALKARLVLSQRIRSFATDTLKLPDNLASSRSNCS